MHILLTSGSCLPRAHLCDLPPSDGSAALPARVPCEYPLWGELQHDADGNGGDDLTVYDPITGLHSLTAGPQLAACLV